MTPTADPSLPVLFAAVLLASLAVEVWLARRQMRHVAAHRDAVPAAFADTISPEAHRRAADYTVAKMRHGMAATAYATALALGWTLLGGLAALDDEVRGATLARFGPMACQLALLGAFFVVARLLALPLRWRTVFGLEQRFGFNRMTPRLFLVDQATGLLVGAAIGLPVAAALLWLMRAGGGGWWLWAWAGWMAFALAASVVWPMFVAPLFNRFSPLADDALRSRVEALMARCGFASRGLQVMDGSRRSAHANAYFTGFGRARRVVLFDTLLARLSTAEIEAVLAHELGHFRLRHVPRRFALMFSLGLAAFALLGAMSAGDGFGFGMATETAAGTPRDAVVLLLFVLLLPALGRLVLPLLASMSRRHEFEADAYAAAQASGAELASALLRLHADNAATLTPDPVYVRLRYSHPPAAQRLAALQARAGGDHAGAGVAMAAA